MKRLLLIPSVLLASLGFASQALATPISYAGQSWSVYNSTGTLGQIWSPSQVSVVGDTLTEKIDGNVAGGIGSKSFRTYGTYNATFRLTAGGGKACIGLYGSVIHQEIDFAESKIGDSNRTIMTATLHWGLANHMQHFTVPGDFTQWHTATVVWKPGDLTFLMDGKVFGHTTSHVPTFPMKPAIQTAGNVIGGAGGPAQLDVTNFTVS